MERKNTVTEKNRILETKKKTYTHNMDETKAQSVFIVDGYGLIFREYWAFSKRPLTNPLGENISAVHGFFNNLALTIRSFKPDFLVVALDSKTKTFRHELFSAYKANRDPAPEDLTKQFPIIESLLLELGAEGIRVDGFEADDVIASIAEREKNNGRTVFILSSDKDLLQLVCENVKVMRPSKLKNAIWEIVNAEIVKKEWGVAPSQILDFLSLTGDSADNVPGVHGVGKKFAENLLLEYGSLDGIFENVEKIKGALGKKVRDGKESAYFSKKLISLKSDVPLDFAPIDSIESFAVSSFLFSKLSEKARALSLNRVATLFDELSGFSPQLSFDVQEIVKKNEGNYKAVVEKSELFSLIDEAIQSGIVALDTETTSLNTRTANLVGFSLSWKEGGGIYVPLCSPEGKAMEKNAAFFALSRLFSSGAKIVFHNAKFDLEILFSNGFLSFLKNQKNEPKTDSNQLELFSDFYEREQELKKNIEQIEDFDIFFQDKSKIQDTMIAAWVLSPDGFEGEKSSFSLSALSKRFLHLRGIEFEEIVEKKQNFSDVPLEKAASYCAEDSDFTLQLYKKLVDLLENASLKTVYEDEIALIPIISKMELRGIHLSSSVLSDYSATLNDKLALLSEKIYAASGHEFNIASTKQFGEVLFEEMGLKGKKKTKAGSFSTDEAALRELKDVPIVSDVLDWRGASKLLSTYVDALPLLCDESSRVHTSFVQTGTATGRLSSRDPNLQNIPVRTEEGRQIRRAFTAENGKVLISADYAQIELVVLAHLSGDKNLCRAFWEGIDVHKSTAALIYGCDISDVTADMRRRAKTFNFGIMYGMGAFSLAKDLGIGYREADDFIKSYFSVYSGVADFFERTVKEAENTLFTKTISGRKREIREIASANVHAREAAVRIAKNSPIQGSAADIVKKAMKDVDEALKQNPTGASLLLQVHDELIFECVDDKDAISDTIALIRDKMEHAWILNVPLKVSIEYGKNWGAFH